MADLFVLFVVVPLIASGIPLFSRLDRLMAQERDRRTHTLPAHKPYVRKKALKKLRTVYAHRNNIKTLSCAESDTGHL